jgi:signal transduction histidine kinase
LVLDIRDDGVGISGWTEGLDLASVESTKGRPGMGLSTVTEIVAASRARVRLAASGPGGTHVELVLPDRVRGVRQI